MTDHQPGHGPFDELAAGYALDALEPADEQRFLRHARDCPACARALADFREVAAALADTAPAAEPRPQLADRILAAALADLEPGRRPGTLPADFTPPGDFPAAAITAAAPRAPGPAAPGDPAAATPGEAAAPPGGALPPGVLPLRRRARRWLRPASAAAALALIAGGGIWGGLAATTSGSPASAACAHPHACPQVTLIAQATRRVAATVLIRSGEAWMKPARMAANPADDIYVLWQITGSHRPLAVGSFDVRPGSNTSIKIGALAASYHSTLAFAVSLEHGRTIPAAPSRVVALGQVS